MGRLSAADFVQSLRFGAAGLRPDDYDRLVQDVTAAWHTGWTPDDLRAYLTDGTGFCVSLAAEYLRRINPAVLPPHPGAVKDGRERCRLHRGILAPCELCDVSKGGEGGSGRIYGADAVRAVLRDNAAAFRNRPRRLREPEQKPPAERPASVRKRPALTWRELTTAERAAEEWARGQALADLAAFDEGRTGGGPVPDQTRGEDLGARRGEGPHPAPNPGGRLPPRGEATAAEAAGMEPGSPGPVVLFG